MVFANSMDDFGRPYRLEDLSNPWVFISHSNKDFKAVRMVRNHLEESGHRPLLFYLKCFDDFENLSVEQQNRLEELIYAEISARKWFVLCDSKNARESAWVQKEAAFIKKSPTAHYTVIDVDSDFETQRHKLLRFAESMCFPGDGGIIVA